MLEPCYLIYGDRPREILEIISAIKKQAYNQGYTNMVVIDVNAQLDWEQLLNKCQNLDLFAAKTFMELRLQSDSLDKHANTVLTNFLQQQQQDPNFCIAVTAPKLKGATLNSTWVKHIQKYGEVHAIKSLPEIFKLTNAAMAGDVQQTIKLVQCLENSGEEPILILWGIVREIRQLLHVKYKTQQSRYHQQPALARLSVEGLQDLLKFSSKIDQMIKGIIPGNCWDALLSLCLSLASPTSNPIPMEEATI